MHWNKPRLRMQFCPVFDIVCMVWSFVDTADDVDESWLWSSTTDICQWSSVECISLSDTDSTKESSDNHTVRLDRVNVQLPHFTMEHILYTSDVQSIFQARYESLTEKKTRFRRSITLLKTTVTKTNLNKMPNWSFVMSKNPRFYRFHLTIILAD